MHGFGTTKSIMCLVFGCMYRYIFQFATCIYETRIIGQNIESVPCTRSYRIHYFKSFNFDTLDAEDNNSSKLFETLKPGVQGKTAKSREY